MQDNPLENPQTQPGLKPGDTQPVRVQHGPQVNLPAGGPTSPTSGSKSTRKKRAGMPIWLIVLLVLILLAIAITAGAIAGYLNGSQTRQAAISVQSTQSLEEQYQLGLQDLAEGRFAMARQRFEYVLSHNPGHPGAVDNLAEAMSILYATSTPTSLPPTVVPTPTFDTRPIQDLFSNAVSLFNTSAWSQAIDTIASLRQADLSYQSARVDGMLYAAFRYRGVEKILQQGNLQGGVFDLSLAERLGPLDIEAVNIRTWARLYMIGTSFWEVFPEQAVYFFSQVAAAAPGLHDSSGWTAMERYRGALIQYGDQLANDGKWCEAVAQYQLAMNIRNDAALQPVFATATVNCTPPTAAYTLTPTFTLVYTTTATLTPTGILLPSDTPTATFIPPVDTETPIPPTGTPVPPTATPAPTDTVPVPTP